MTGANIKAKIYHRRTDIQTDQHLDMDSGAHDSSREVNLLAEHLKEHF